MSNCQHDTRPKAAKAHRCDECGMTIPKGAVHYVQTGVFDGAPYRWRVHSDCAEMYWRVNKDEGNWDIGEMTRLFDMCPDERSMYRGSFPHVVCRFELREQLQEARL